MSMLLRRHYADNSNNTKGAPETVAPKVEEKAEKSEFKITADDINKMTGPKLRKLARENGIESPEELTVNELKAILVEKYS